MATHSRQSAQNGTGGGSSNQVVNLYNCESEGCGKSFSTQIGLGLHRSRAHRDEYNRDIRIPVRKVRWSAQDVTLLARLEAELIHRQGGVPDDINLRLVEEMPNRTFDSIKSQRKRATYRAILQEEIAKLSAVTTESAPTTEIPREVTSNEIEADHRGIVAKVAELAATVKPDSDMHKDLLHLAHEFVRGESYVELLNEFLRRHFLVPPRRQQHQSRGERRILTKRAQRREDYAKMQDLFRKNRSACARMVLDGASSVNIQDDSKFTDYWARMMTTPPPELLENREVESNAAFQHLAEPISVKEVCCALKGPAKAIGPDGVDLRKLRQTSISALCCIMNIIYASPVPDPHRAARVVFIPKTAEASGPEHFRPISVGSYLQRVLNKILARRMQATLDILALQRAFRPFDGTYENLNIIDAVIRDARRSRRELRLASLDLRKAFDMVSHDSIVNALTSRGYPKFFTRYVKNLYERSTTVISYGVSTRNIAPTRGVRQGDPLSPILFNLVLDEVFQSLSKEGFGYDTGVERILGVAYADDVILAADSKATLQRLLDTAVPMLEKRGLSINVDKSFSVTLVAAGKVKKVKVIDTPEFKIAGGLLPCRGVDAMWKYLGIMFDDRGRLPPNCASLSDFLDRISAAPLKPAQRLIILKDYLVPRFMHRLICSQTPTAKLLREYDQRIRNVVKRKWLHLDSSIPTGFLYAKNAHGGLGLPCLLTSVPRTRLARMMKLAASDHLAVNWACSTEGFIADMAKTKALCKQLQCTIENAQQESEYWARRLYDTFDGRHMRDAAKVPYVHRWLFGMPYLSGREFVNLVKCRINALPTRARLARGRPLYNDRCRHGCDQVETLNHVTQICGSTHRATVKRHDDICGYIAKSLRKFGHEVQREKLYRVPGCPGLKPDLVVITSNQVHVLDVEICGTSRDLRRARNDKICKYKVDWLANLLPCPEKKRVYGTITVSSTGIWNPDSAIDLMYLGFTKARLVDLTVQVIQGTLRTFRIFMEFKERRLGTRRTTRRVP